MKKYETTIIGAGLSGLFLAKKLAEKGRRVLLVDRKTDLTKGVHTTGIFVRKTFEDFGFCEGALGKPISKVNLYSPSLRSLELESEYPEFRVGRMGLIYASMLEEARDLGVDFESGAGYKWAVPKKKLSTLLTGSGEVSDSRSVVCFERNGQKTFIETEVLVGADGCRSNVAKDLSLDQNSDWIVGYENVYDAGTVPSEPVLHCFLDNELAPGYLAWISHDGEEIHVGVGGYPNRFEPKKSLNIFLESVVPQIIDVSKAKSIESRGGRIPVGGVLNRIASPYGVLIGDAAGAVSPLTAGGLDPCLRLSDFAAKVIERRLETRSPNQLLEYSGSMFRRKFAKRLLLRFGLKNFSSRVALEAGFSFLKTGIGRTLADEIFFRRASFPDVTEEVLGKVIEEGA